MAHDELSMKIAQNIDVIEAACAHIDDIMLPKIFTEFCGLFNAFVDKYDLECRLGDDFDDDFYICDANWGRDGRNKPFLRIELGSDVGPSGVESKSWLGNLCGYAECSMNLYLGCHSISQKAWKNLVMSDKKFIRNLCRAGFQRDADDGGSLWYPLKIDRHELADAFMSGDFSAALYPVEQVLEQIRTVWADLDQMAAAIRSEQQ